MAIIYLARTLLFGSSGLPKDRDSNPESFERTTLLLRRETTFILDLASGVVCRVLPEAGSLYGTSDITVEAVSSYLAFSPLPQLSRGGIFSVALSVVPNQRNTRMLSGTLFYEVRTFLFPFLSESNCPVCISDYSLN